MWCTCTYNLPDVFLKLAVETLRQHLPHSSILMMWLQVHVAQLNTGYVVGMSDTLISQHREYQHRLYIPVEHIIYSTSI